MAAKAVAEKAAGSAAATAEEAGAVDLEEGSAVAMVVAVKVEEV